MDPVDAARELLPLPVRYGNVVLFPLLAAAGTAAVLLPVYLLVRSRPDAEGGWAEHARGFVTGLWSLGRATLFSFLAVALASVWFIGPLGGVDPVGMVVVAGLACWLVASQAHARFRLRHQAWLDTRSLRRGRVGQFLLLRLPWLPVFLTLAVLPADPGPAFFVILVPGVAALLYGTIGGGLRVARLLGLARPAPEDLRRVVGRVCEDADRPPPELLVAEMSSANAVAFPLLGAMVVSERALAVLSEEEIARVAAHELSHLDEPRRETAKRFLTLPLMFVVLGQRPLQAHLPLSLVLALVALGLYLALRARRVAHRLETVADEDAGGTDGDAVKVYATALEKLYRENLVPPVLSRHKQSHPELYDRLVAAGVPPDYPRPDPPRASLWITLLSGLASLLLLGCLASGGTLAKTVAPWSDRAALAAIAVTGGDAGVLRELAGHRERAGRLDDAEVFREAADYLDD